MAKIKDKERIVKAARGDFPGSPVAPEIRTPEYVKEILTDIKRETDIVDLNTHLHQGRDVRSR